MLDARLNRLLTRVLDANHALARLDLVSGSSGNASGYDPENGILFIKPSGFDCEALTLECLVGVNLHGRVVHGDLRPSVDTPHHLTVYKKVPRVAGIVHTRSPYATAFAACERAIQAYITSIADVFGSEIPCTEYVGPEGDLGEVLAEMATKYPGCLAARHGVFAFGRTPEDAVRTAAVIEDAAKTAYLALSLSPKGPLTPEETARWHRRYLSKYGQRRDGDCEGTQ